MDMNTVSLSGRVGQDPTIEKTQKGHDYARFSIANKPTAGKDDPTHWLTVWVFNPGLVKIVSEHVKKGAFIGIEGRLTSRKVEVDGQKREELQLVLSDNGDQIFLWSRPNGDSAADA